MAYWFRYQYSTSEADYWLPTETQDGAAETGAACKGV